MRRNIARLALGCVLCAHVPAAAQSRSLDILDFHATIAVARSGEVRVTERITVRFDGEWNGLYRTIPVEYETPQGLRYALRLQLISATDGAGAALKYENERDGRNRRLRMWVPGAVNATRTVVLTYASPNALRFFEEHDQLYWNVTGDEWAYPIRRARADVILPETVEGVRFASFAGPRGSQQDGGRAQQTGNAVYFEADRETGYGEGLTIVVGWNPGIVHRPTVAERAGRTLAANSILAVPVAVFFAMLGLWRRFGRDPDPGSILVRYEPPPELTPAEAGTLIDNRPDLRDITATLIDLAIRGFLVIEELQQDRMFGLISTRDYELDLQQRDRWHELKPHERTLLRALSSHATADRVLLSDLQNQFYRDLPEIRRHLRSTLVEGGHYQRHPELVRVLWFVAAGLAATGVGVMAAALSSLFYIAPLAILVAVLLTFVVIAAFAWVMPARTPEGARVHAWLRGFQEFLDRVEKDRLARISHSPEMFERFLPYAMAFGVETNWARAFDGLASTPPSWYRGSSGGPFRPALFVGDLGRMSSAAGSAMTSAPRSSGSSSSSGSSGFSGGFSGGGFGGGGGGGF